MVYTALADSDIVEVWILERSILTFFHNENIQQNFFNLIEKLDLPNPKEGLCKNSREISNWNQFKRETFKGL